MQKLSCNGDYRYTAACKKIMNDDGALQTLEVDESKDAGSDPKYFSVLIR